MSQVEIERLDRANQQVQADGLEAVSVAEPGKDGGVGTREPHADLLRFTGKRLESIEAAYRGSLLTTREISRQFSISTVELRRLVKLHGWPERVKGSRA